MKKPTFPLLPEIEAYFSEHPPTQLISFNAQKMTDAKKFYEANLAICKAHPKPVMRPYYDRLITYYEHCKSHE